MPLPPNAAAPANRVCVPGLTRWSLVTHADRIVPASEPDPFVMPWDDGYVDPLANDFGVPAASAASEQRPMPRRVQCLRGDADASFQTPPGANPMTHLGRSLLHPPKVSSPLRNALSAPAPVAATPSSDLSAGQTTDAASEGATAASTRGLQRTRGGRPLLRRLEQVRRTWAAPVRWSPAPLPPLPRHSVGGPYATLVPSPLRADGQGLAGWTTQVALGDARFRQRPSDLMGAAAQWLAAWRGADRLAVAAALEDRILRGRRVDTSSALLSFHLACYSPDPERARQAIRHAYGARPRLESAMRKMLDLSGDSPLYTRPFLHLFPSFSALSKRATSEQQRLFTLALDLDWQGVKPLAEELAFHFPHLLVPQCLKFVAHLMLGRFEEDLGDELDDAADQARAHEVMDFVRDLDANGHFWATGALTQEQHNWSWSTFLEAWYAIEPRAFGASYDDEGAIIEVAPHERRVAGLPLALAIQLPLGGTWAEAVATWNETEAGQPMRIDDLVSTSGP